MRPTVKSLDIYSDTDESLNIATTTLNQLMSITKRENTINCQCTIKRVIYMEYPAGGGGGG